MQNIVVSIESIYSHSLRKEHFTALSTYSAEVPEVGALLKFDEFNLDAFHHAIISSNVVLMKVLTSVLSEYQCIAQNKLPYLHLAAIFGHEKLEDDVRKLCEILKPDEKVQDSWWSIVDELRNNGNFRGLLRKYLNDEQFNLIFHKFECLLRKVFQHRNEYFSAVDVAAICKNTNYVELFLQKLTRDRRSSQRFRKLSTAFEISSSFAVHSLVDEFTEEELYKILARKVEELKVNDARMIMKTKKIKARRTRAEPNLFHLACSSRQQHCGLDEMVALLVDYGFDVNDNPHPCTYPLYSMIYSFVCERDVNPKKVPIYHMNSLQTLLKAGASPNFDEIRDISHSQNPLTPLNTTRDPSSSALECYFQCLQFHEKWDVNLMEQLDQICLLLLENGADPTYNGTTCGSPLHSLMQLAACHHAQGHLSADFFSMSRMLLYFGADPDYQSENSLCHTENDFNQSEKTSCYPVEFYFHRIFALMGGRIALDRWIKSSAVNQVAGLMTYMNRDDACRMYHSICAKADEIVASGEVGFNREVARHIRLTLLEYLTPVRSLQDFCRLALWRGHKRKVNNLKRLHMPKKMIGEIISFFALEI